MSTNDELPTMVKLHAQYVADAIFPSNFDSRRRDLLEGVLLDFARTIIGASKAAN